MTVLRWENPPPNRISARPTRRVGAGLRRWQPVADELRRRPGQWALIFEGANGPASGLASNIVRGVPACWEPAGDFDATTRKGAESTLVYARYVGSSCEAFADA